MSEVKHDQEQIDEILPALAAGAGVIAAKAAAQHGAEALAKRKKKKLEAKKKKPVAKKKVKEDVWKEEFRQWRDDNYEYVTEDEEQVDELVGTALAVGAGALAAKKLKDKLTSGETQKKRLRKKQLKKERKVAKKFEKKVHKAELKSAKGAQKKKNRAEIKGIKKGSQDVTRDHVEPMTAYTNILSSSNR